MLKPTMTYGITLHQTTFQIVLSIKEIIKLPTTPFPFLKVHKTKQAQKFIAINIFDTMPLDNKLTQDP
jgi:hypothetical protein